MDKPPIGGAGKHDNEIPQTRPTACPGLEELELYFRGKSPMTDAIQKHIEEECPSCSAYLALRSSSQGDSDPVLEGFFQDIEQDARAGYPSVRESLANHQETDHPTTRRTAAQQRYGLNVPTFQIDFRAEQQRLQLYWDDKAKVTYENYTFRYVLLITSFEREAGEETFAFQIELAEVYDASGTAVKRRPAHWPDPKNFAADLLLADDTRLPLTRHVVKEKIKEKEVVRASWTSPQVSSEQLPQQAGERLFRIEAFPLQVHGESAALQQEEEEESATQCEEHEATDNN